MPELTADELVSDVERETAVLAAVPDVDRLLTTLRSLDSDDDDLADNEEIQVLSLNVRSPWITY